jgi:hypothetical protein
MPFELDTHPVRSFLLCVPILADPKGFLLQNCTYD